MVYKENSKEILHRYIKLFEYPPLKNLNTSPKNIEYPPLKILNTPPLKNLKDNNTDNNNTINNTKEYIKEDDSIPYQSIIEYLNGKRRQITDTRQQRQEH